MRIENNLRTGSVAARTTARPGSANPEFLVSEEGAAARAAASSAPVAAAPIGALLALQAVEDPTAGRKRQLRRGRSLLDILDALKADLVTGKVSEGHLNQLMLIVGQARERGEPGLDALLDDIELRARVELAKRGLYPAL